MTVFDHRLVLDNPRMGWPADVWAEAERQREAELMALRPDAPTSTTIVDVPVLRATPRAAPVAACNPIIARLCGAGAFLTISTVFAYMWGI